MGDIKRAINLGLILLSFTGCSSSDGGFTKCLPVGIVKEIHIKRTVPDPDPVKPSLVVVKILKHEQVKKFLKLLRHSREIHGTHIETIDYEIDVIFHDGSKALISIVSWKNLFWYSGPGCHKEFQASTDVKDMIDRRFSSL